MNMQAQPSQGPVSVGAVVVVYYPDMPRLRQLVQRLASLVGCVVLVNNGADVLATTDFSPFGDGPAQGTQLNVLNCGRNLGVAAALNQGVRCLEEWGCTLAWSFDQDSLPAADALAVLMNAWQCASLVALAPAVHEEARDQPLPFLVLGEAGLACAQIVSGAQEVAAAITSGLLFRIDAWQAVGGALEPLFIDHVDTEWCCRVRAAGWRILAVPAARISHQLGQPGPRFARLGHRVVLRPAMRTYYMLRNGWLLGRMAYAPPGWRRYQMRQAVKIIIVALLHGPQRWSQLRAILRAVRDARRSHAWVR